MPVRVTPWDDERAPNDVLVRQRFEAEGLRPSTWSNGPGDTYASHRHDYHKVLYCVAGSITFHLEGEDVQLGPGDRLDLPAGMRHAATVGPGGVRCMEAARYGA